MSVKAPEVRLLVLIGSLKVTSMDETYELRGLGETAVIELTESGGQDLHGLLGRAGGRLDVAGVVGRDAVEAVGVAGLAGEESGRDRRASRWRGSVNAPPFFDT